MESNNFATLALICIALAGCATAPAPLQQPATQTVQVIQRRYHTDIALPANELAGGLEYYRTRFPRLHTALFGFGDREFVLTRRKTIGTFLAAMLPARGAILVTGLVVPPEQAFAADKIVTLHVSDTALAGIEAFIWRSLETDGEKPRFIGNGPYPGSLFYGSTRTYDLANTCNTWTAEALRAGGLPAPVQLTLFSFQTMDAARSLVRAQVAPETTRGQ